MCPIVYQVFHDLAGPVATVLAAGAAFFVAWRFGSQQAAIAKTQAETALDRLRYDLLEKRYQIYDTAKQLMRVAVNDSMKKDFGAGDVIPRYLVLDEALFFFPRDICEFLESVQKQCQRLIELNAEKNNPSYAYSKEENDEIRAVTRGILDALTSMPSRFERDLKFPQLTGR